MTQGVLRRLESGRLRVSHAVRAGRMVWAAAPALAAAWSVLLVLQGAIPAVVVYVTKRVVDAANDAVGGGLALDNVATAAGWAGAMVGLVVVQRALGVVVSYVQTAQAERVQDEIKGQIHTKAAAVDYAFYESEDYHDKLQHSNYQASGRALGLVTSAGALVRDGIAFGSIAVLLAVQYAPWLPLALIVGTMPVLWVVSVHNRRYNEWWRHSMGRRRWADYLDVVLTYPEYAAELRLFGSGPELASQYQGSRRALRDERLALLRRQSAASLGATLLGLVVLAGVFAWVARRALVGEGTLGDLALFYQALNQGLALSRSVVGGAGQVYANTLFLEDLFLFLDIERSRADPARPARFPDRIKDGITFEDVTFRYPGAQQPSLTKLNLHLQNGKITAVVGANGAGKSTLVKLMCRFYDPEAGRVLIDGVDVREFAHQDLLDRVSVLFQTPVQYQASATANIRFPGLVATDDEIVRASKAAGSHEFVEALPRGYETRLGKVFYEGGELSGGQWQRVALARAYLRQAPILVLDEPTSAMDSWSEMEWFERLRTLAEGRTSLVITHRFTVAMQADVIHVMDDGAVVESGSHVNLLEQDGLYAKSWNEQTRRAALAGERTS